VRELKKLEDKDREELDILEEVKRGLNQEIGDLEEKIRKREGKGFFDYELGKLTAYRDVRSWITTLEFLEKSKSESKEREEGVG